ncbi:hypothetical protein FTO68_01380 [Methanocalculus taiwanensis]|uniref:UBP-type domain-containing protein n=1 Tax=Methanocalculus taiwanensis TaxID=106207 RepID=A0ABD4TJX4_9EURY|nr:hypothetical protein [Methanocalculus taiwanensis]
MTDYRCTICGEKAVGCQVYGCSGSYVCLLHADAHLLNLKPGERKEWGACYFLRFLESDTDE